MSYPEDNTLIAPVRRQQQTTMIAPAPFGVDSTLRLQATQQDRNQAANAAGLRGFNDYWNQQNKGNLSGLGELYGVQRGMVSGMGQPSRPQTDEEYLGAIRQRAQQHYMQNVAPTLTSVQQIQSGIAPNMQLQEAIRRGYSPEDLALRKGAVDRQAADTGLVNAQGYGIQRTADAQYRGADAQHVAATGRAALDQANASDITAKTAGGVEAQRLANQRAGIENQYAPNALRARNDQAAADVQGAQIANETNRQLIAPRVAQAGADVQKAQIENDTNTQLIAPRVRMAGAQAQQTEQLIAPAVRGANAQADLTEAQATGFRSGGMKIGPNGKPVSASMTPADRAAAVKAATDPTTGGVNRDAVSYIENGQWPEGQPPVNVAPAEPGVMDRAKAASDAAAEVATPNSVGNAAQYLFPVIPAYRAVSAARRAFTGNQNPAQPAAPATPSAAPARTRLTPNADGTFSAPDGTRYRRLPDGRWQQL